MVISSIGILYIMKTGAKEVLMKLVTIMGLLGFLLKTDFGST